MQNINNQYNSFGELTQQEKDQIDMIKNGIGLLIQSGLLALVFYVMYIFMHICLTV